MKETELKFQNNLLDASISIAEIEREKISKNLHDEIGTLINVIKQNNSRLKKSDANPDEKTDIIETNNKLLLEINENVRTISNELHSPTLSRLGFFSALELLTEQISDAKVMNIELISNIDSKSRFEAKLEIQLYRVCKELINNILKHSNSTKVRLDIKKTNNALDIIIEYNGKGINDNDVQTIISGNNKGLGLKSIYSRVQIMKGQIHYVTPDNKNAKIVIQIPI
ncbi:MAG: sensor histidine kinase [Bacteroidia bacterium]